MFSPRIIFSTVSGNAQGWGQGFGVTYVNGRDTAILMLIVSRSNTSDNTTVSNATIGSQALTQIGTRLVTNGSQYTRVTALILLKANYPTFGGSWWTTYQLPSGTCTGSTVAIIQVEGIVQESPIDQLLNSATSSVTSWLDSITTSYDDELLIGLDGLENNAATSTPTSPLIELFDDGSGPGRLIVNYEEVETAGSANYENTYSTTITGRGRILLGMRPSIIHATSPPVFQTSSTGSSLATTTLSFTASLSSGSSDRIAVVFVNSRGNNNADATVTGVTLGGVAMTSLGSIPDNGGNAFQVRATAYYLLEASIPAGGTATCVINTTGGSNTQSILGCCVIVSGAKQQAPNVATTGADYVSVNPWLNNITPAETNSLLMDGFVTDGTYTYTATWPQTGQVNYQANGNALNVSTMDVGPTTATAMGWGYSSNGRFAQIILAMAPAPGSASDLAAFFGMPF